MRKSLVIMSIMGLSATYVNANVQTTFEPPSTNSFASADNTLPSTSYATISNESKTLSIKSVDQIGQTIEELRAKAQNREDQLSALADELTERQAASTFTMSNASLATSNMATLDSSAPPAIAAARASKVAHARSQGLCARYVRKALQAAGYQFTPNASAYQYATRGTLAQAGFVKISNNNYKPQIGDVAVFNRTSKNPHGHIQIYNGTQWISDFKQRKFSPYSVHNGYSVWRDARYRDASNTGIYLAMDE